MSLEAPTGRAALDAVLAVVQRHTLLPAHAILGHRREAAIVASRHAACWLLRTVTDLSLPAIGGLMNGRDHTTILHAVQQVERRRAEDAGFHGRLALMALEVRHVLTGRDDEVAAPVTAAPLAREQPIAPETRLRARSSRAEVEARRAEVQALWDAGERRPKRIAVTLGVTIDSIVNDLSALGLSAAAAKRARDQIIAELLATGLGPSEVGRRVGLTAACVVQVRKRLRERGVLPATLACQTEAAE